MDYRYYRGDGPKIPSKWRKYVHLMRYIGTGMLIFGVLIPWLIILDFFPSTFFWNFLSSGLTVVGMMSVVIGMIFNNLIDRG